MICREGTCSFMCTLTVHVHTWISQEDRGRLKAEVEAKDAEIDSQHGQLQTLTVSS